MLLKYWKWWFMNGVHYGTIIRLNLQVCWMGIKITSGINHLLLFLKKQLFAKDGIGLIWTAKAKLSDWSSRKVMTYMPNDPDKFVKKNTTTDCCYKHGQEEGNLDSQVVSHKAQVQWTRIPIRYAEHSQINILIVLPNTHIQQWRRPLGTLSQQQSSNEVNFVTEELTASCYSHSFADSLWELQREVAFYSYK
jgi:hypothetical protein